MALISRKRDAILVGDAFVQHQLRINDVYIAFKFQPAPPPLTFRLWRVPREPLSATAPIVPDGYVELSAPAKVLAMFIEVDLGTERTELWRKKTQAYLRFAVSGDFEKLSGHLQFRVLIITDSERRTDSIRSLIARYTEKIFWLANFESMKQRGVWAPIWLRPGGSEGIRLVE